MLHDDQTFVRLDIDDIEVGVPLRFPLHNGNRQLIVGKGEIIPTRADAERLFLSGVYRLVLIENAVNPAAASPGQGVRPASAARPAAAKDAAKEPAEESRSSAPRSGRTPELTLENSRIRVGDPILLQAGPEAPRYSCRLIGFLKNRSVIVTQPEADGELALLREGQAFSCRFFSGQSAFQFSTAIIKQTSVPYPLLHLSYPRELRVQTVRRSPRVEVDLIASIEVGEKASQYSGRVIDLGTSGAALRTRNAVAGRDETICLKFKLSTLDVDNFVSINALVRSITVREGDTVMPYQYGLQFVDVDNHARIVLAAYVFGRMLGDV